MVSYKLCYGPINPGFGTKRPSWVHLFWGACFWAYPVYVVANLHRLEVVRYDVYGNLIQNRVNIFFVSEVLRSHSDSVSVLSPHSHFSVQPGRCVNAVGIRAGFSDTTRRSFSARPFKLFCGRRFGKSSSQCLALQSLKQP
ncbi:unnamed protein product [Gongylonema pulchrum]|uniref:Transmembrane protein n=1 Tax=Gongylonema pulchrum TaxID=637853 RepID=A0A183DRJ1_9BILA|nr:unnamed protein product [Gongylonema pulchrum]